MNFADSPRALARPRCNFFRPPQMRRPCVTSVVRLLVASGTVLAQSERPNVCSIETSERIVVVADIHGAYDRFIAILRAADLIDGRANGTGGRGR